MNAGIGITVAFGVVLIGTWIIMMLMKDMDTRVTAKYVFLVATPQISGLFFFLTHFNGGKTETISSFVALSSLILLLLLSMVISVCLSPRMKKKKDLSDYDPMLGRWGYAAAFYGGLIFIAIVGNIVLGAVTFYGALRSLEWGAIVVISLAALVMAVSWLMSYADIFRDIRKAEAGKYTQIKEMAKQPSVQPTGKPVKKVKESQRVTEMKIQAGMTGTQLFGFDEA